MSNRRSHEVCGSCAASPRGGCCWIPEEDAQEYQFPMTLMDVARIVEATGLDPRAFSVRDRVSAEQLDDYAQFDGMERMCPVGIRHRLKLRKSGHCVFLEEGKGCSLGEAKPMVCKLFPFWVSKTGDLMWLSTPTSDGCMAMQLGKSQPHIIAHLLDVDLHDVYEWFAQLQQEIQMMYEE